MSEKYPSKEKAHEIFAELLEYRRTNPPKRRLREYIEAEFICHSQNVATCASIIAKKIAYLNPDKAYVLGLLHDYGKIKDELFENKHHGQYGYEQMLLAGYPDVAKICLTHTFPTKNFADKDFPYPKEWLSWLRSHLENVEYDDYDRLIQLCDKFAERLELVSIEYRVGEIVKRYNLDDSTKQALLDESLGLKQYFDMLCGEDIYKILGIKDEGSKL